MLVLGIVCFFIPANFVVLNSWVQGISQFTLIAGIALGSFLAIRSGSRAAHAVLFLVVFLMISGSIVSADPLGTVSTLGPAIVGLGTAISIRGKWLASVLILFGVSTVGLVIDSFLGSNLISIFGAQSLEVTAGSSERARGFIGQPVPAAALSAFLFVTGLALSRDARVEKRRHLIQFALIILAGTSLFLTGTRSALLLIGCGLILLALASPLPKKIGVGAVFAGIGIASIGIVGTIFLLPRLESSRLFAFDELTGSASLDNRLYSTEILSLWAGRCDALCATFGSGPRSLQSDLQSVYGILGLSTIDNIWVTLLWDFGISAIAICAILLIWAFHSLISNRSRTARMAGAAGVLTMLASGFIFDAFYVRPILITLGFLVGMLIWGEAGRARVDEMEPPSMQRSSLRKRFSGELLPSESRHSPYGS